jgi:hypothetical protein
MIAESLKAFSKHGLLVIVRIYVYCYSLQLDLKYILKNSVEENDRIYGALITTNLHS